MIIKSIKTTIKAYDWKCPHYKTYQKYNLKHYVKSIHENLRCHCNLYSYNTTRTNYLCKQKYSNYVQKHQENAILKVLKVFMKMYAIIVNYALTQQIVPAI